MTTYRDIEDALQVVDRYGSHVRDIRLLAGLGNVRPASSVMGAEAYPELAVKAAALLESVARFHPLIDGNQTDGKNAHGAAAVDQRLPA